MDCRLLPSCETHSIDGYGSHAPGHSPTDLALLFVAFPPFARVALVQAPFGICQDTSSKPNWRRSGSSAVQVSQTCATT